MVNGLTPQFMNSVTPMPRQCSVTCRRAVKSIFISIGMIINQISTATAGSRSRPRRCRRPATTWNDIADRHPGDDAQRDPDREVAFEQVHAPSP